MFDAATAQAAPEYSIQAVEHYGLVKGLKRINCDSPLPMHEWCSTWYVRSGAGREERLLGG